MLTRLLSVIAVSVPPEVQTKSFSSQATIATTITSVIAIIIGAGSVIMIVVGALMYVLSAGDAGKTVRAKDTIIYAVVGVVIALLAYGIVTFVISKFS
jgi:hypothetical protein